MADERFDDGSDAIGSEAAPFAWLSPGITSRVLEIVKDAILVVDTSGTILQVNEAFAQLSGHEAWTLEGASVAMLVHDPHGDPVEAIASLVEATPEWTGRASLRRADGQLVECEVWLRRIDGDDGAWWVAVQQEVRAIRRYGSIKMEETEALVHELVSSLAGIRGYVDLLERRSPEDQAEVCARLTSLARRTADRLHNLLHEVGGVPLGRG